MNLNFEKIQKIGSIFSIIVLCLITLSSSITALAQEVIPLPSPTVTSVPQILNILDYVTDIVFTVVIIIAVIMFLIAAVTYITAQGDTTKTGKASKMLMYAAIGLGVALLARGIEAIITGILKTTV